mmetsp:Transcript_15497/g.51250  ORF Transcript_15497/g.51250 Transcript_15497/m.51250 type:complete len:201 (+) Transcript_15497:170-772(+)
MATSGVAVSAKRCPSSGSPRSARASVSPERRRASLSIGGPTSWLRTMDAASADCSGAAHSNLAPISSTRPSETPACVTKPSQPKRRIACGAPELAAPAAVPAAIAPRRAAKKAVAAGQARRSSPSSIEPPVVVKKKRRTRGIAPSISAASCAPRPPPARLSLSPRGDFAAARSASALRPATPATMQASIGSTQGSDPLAA